MQLAELSEAQRTQALARYQMLQPYLEGHSSLATVLKAHGLARRTAQRWVRRYRAEGLAGLAHKTRDDKGLHHIEAELQQLIEALALQKIKPTVAAIHRQVVPIAQQNGWHVPSYDCVHDVVRGLDRGLLVLAHEGSSAYQQQYDLLYRREANHPNEIWQADHTCLDIWVSSQKIGGNETQTRAGWPRARMMSARAGIS